MRQSCDREDVVGAVPAQPGAALASTANSTRVRQPSPSRVARDRLDLHVHVQARQPRELLADDAGLEAPLLRQVDVLEVAAAAQAGAGIRAGRLNPVLARLEHGSTASPRTKRSPLLGLGDAHAHTLARERVPDEDDPALVAGDAVPAVGDGPDLDVDLVADGELAGLARGRRHSPRRTAPTEGPSKRSSWPSDDSSCQGTLATITPGVKSSRDLSRSALWLCRTCSYQRPRTYSGM